MPRVTYPQEPKRGQRHYAQKILDLQDELIEVRDFFAAVEEKTVKRRVNRAIRHLGEARYRLDTIAGMMSRADNIDSDEWEKHA